MVFCGQCGLQLPAGVVRCPRCQAEAEAIVDITAGTLPGDAPTVASATYVQRPQMYPDAPQTAMPFTPSEQQKLILRPTSGGGYPGGNEPTSARNPVDYRTNTRTPTNFQTETPHMGYPNNTGYPVQPNGAYQNNMYTAPEAFYTSNVPSGGAVPSGYPPVPAKKRGGGRIIALLLCLLLAVGVGGFLIVQRAHLFGTSGSGATTDGGTGGTTQNVTPVPPDPANQATAVVQQYYTNVNNKEYQRAYELWKWDGNGPTLTAFKQGYANTLHDDLTIKNATPLADGTVRVTLSIIAKERVNGAIKYHTYAGYYIVGQDGGAWKIMRGVLNRTK